MTYEQMVDKFSTEYLDWYADDIGSFAYEERMVRSTPANLFDGGEDEKEARLCALWHHQMRL